MLEGIGFFVPWTPLPPKFSNAVNFSWCGTKIPSYPQITGSCDFLDHWLCYLPNFPMPSICHGAGRSYLATLILEGIWFFSTVDYATSQVFQCRQFFIVLDEASNKRELWFFRPGILLPPKFSNAGNFSWCGTKLPSYPLIEGIGIFSTVDSATSKIFQCRQFFMVRDKAT